MRIHKAKNGRWGVSKPGNLSASKWLPTKATAIDYARSFGFSIYVYGSDGRIESRIKV